MTRQLEAQREEKQARMDRAVLLALEGGLVADLAHAGAVLSGFGVRLGGAEVLLTLRAELAGRQQISFVGSSSLPEAIVKACRLARRDQLRWRDDKFASG